MLTDPSGMANWWAVKEDFAAWVKDVEQHNLETQDYEAKATHEILAAGNTIVVNRGGSVQDAVDAAPDDGTRTIIQINAGTYKYNTAPAPPGGAVGRQAAALRITGDRGVFYNCKFLGAQDTLYDQHGRHYFKNCFIQGSIDFICGDGQSLYQDCELHSVANPGSGSLTAQKRSGDETTGFAFVGCSVTGSWGPTSSRVVFIRCRFDNLILPQGWYDWGVSSREK